MLAEYPYHPHEKQTRTLYSTTDKRVLNFKAIVHHDKIICGSSHGCYVAFAIYHHHNLAYFKPGDNTWTSIPRPCFFIADVIYYRDQFYVLDCAGRVFACDLNRPHANVSIVTEINTPRYGHRRYLVELSGDLLQVCAHVEHVYDKSYGIHKFFTAGFDAFKLDPVGLKWIETDNLDGHALFVGDNHAFSFLASDFPECKPNAIYYIDDYGEESRERDRDGFADRDIAVFDLADRTIESILSKASIPSPIWVEPTL
ncbi:hypothetical protein AQUCO_02200340v1 [Aquilegia coerulea]|uniref:KIB1-4 beta-propeller domain-containing protein n=1 Tax=Aquilegia coerulea TaxID=218851 RepID=A0A2G5DE96_AQUCA|nr:hypothetical protein AQUCO_02200340v1 [Aquilegia coerulea]